MVVGVRIATTFRGVLTWRGHKEGFWGAGSVVYLALNGGHMGEYICENSLSLTLQICALSYMNITSQLKN